MTTIKAENIRVTRSSSDSLYQQVHTLENDLAAARVYLEVTLNGVQRHAVVDGERVSEDLEQVMEILDHATKIASELSVVARSPAR